jgi:DNA-binding MurR/RpiR family transcriptional regulator
MALPKQFHAAAKINRRLLTRPLFIFCNASCELLKLLLDANGCLATHMAKVIQPSDLLFAVSFRFYATDVVNTVEKTAARGVPIVAISDSTLAPLAKSAQVLFAVPEHEYTFSRSLAAPMCLAQAISVALAARVQQNRPPRIPVVTET